MKTLKEINEEIKTLQKSIKGTGHLFEIKRTSKKIEQLRILKYYIETNPSEDFLRKQLKDIVTKIDTLEQRYGQWCIGKNPDECKIQTYRQMSGISYLNNKKILYHFYYVRR